MEVLVKVTLKSVVSYHVKGSRIEFFAPGGISFRFIPCKLLLLGSPPDEELPAPPELDFLPATTTPTGIKITKSNAITPRKIQNFLPNLLGLSSSSASIYPPLFLRCALPSSARGPLTRLLSVLPSDLLLCFTFSFTTRPVTTFSFVVRFSETTLSLF